MANEYLKRTPTSSGNRKVWTLAGWLKINKDFGSSNYNTVWSVADGTSADNSDRFHLYHYSDGRWVTTGTSSFSQVFTGPGGSAANSRDPGSWMHICLSCNTTISSSTPDQIQRFWVNGVEYIYDDAGNISQNANLAINGPYEHYIGARDSSPSRTYDGQMFDLYLVDGQALTPDVFGSYKDGDGYMSSGAPKATDFRPGQWSPKAPKIIKSIINAKGGFGLNGFYLPMNDSSNPGADFHCDPNSIIKLKGEDLPQPQNGAPTTSDAYVSQLRSDPFAANLVFAIPGISTSTSQDFYTNGNFETGIGGWSSGNGSTLDYEAIGGPSGNGCIRVTSNTTSNGYTFRALDSNLEVGKRYTLSFYYQHVSGGEGYVNIGNNTGGGQIVYRKLDNSNTNWNQIHISFVAEVVGTFVGFYSKAASGVVRFANISLVQEDAARDYSADIRGSGVNKTVNTVTYPDSNTSDHRVPAIVSGYSPYGSYINYDSPENTGGFIDVLDATAFDNVNLTSAEWTYEAWYKSSSTPTSASNLIQFGNTVDYQGFSINIHPNGKFYYVWSYNGSSWGVLSSSDGPVIPQNEWCHIAIVKEANPTPRIVTYLNGVLAKTIDVRDSSNPANSNISYTSPGYLRIGGHYAGKLGGGDTTFYNGGIFDARFYNTVKYKGSFDVSKPYTPIGIESWRTTADTCKNNFATLNSLDFNSSTTALSDGNLTMNATSNNGAVYSATYNIPNSGKYYFELYEKIIDITTTNYIAIQSIVDTSKNQQYRGFGYIYTDSVQASGFATIDEGDLVGVAVDADNGTVSFYNNGTLVSTVTSASVDHIRGATIRSYLPRGAGSYPPGDTRIFNFGQNPSFSGQLTAGTNADDSGKGLFKYDPPTGFLALCEDNLPTPAIADPGEHFKTVLYTGDGNEGRSITGVGFKPDLVWVKCTSHADDHTLTDSVRGADRSLYSNNTNSENTSSIRLQSFDDNGFTTGSSGDTNTSGRTFCAWCWKAGGPTVTNTDGTLTSQVSVNQDAGFSIVKFTAQTSGTGTVGHGLGKKPAFWIYKPHTNSTNWYMYHQSLGASAWLNFTTTDAETGSAAAWGGVEPTSTVLTHGDGLVNQGSCILYAWTEIEGYSKFGSYVGNAAVGDPLPSNGPFVYCGFKPAFVLIKVSSVDNGYWILWDSSRTSINLAGNAMVPNQNWSEIGGFDIDLLSNGFKMRDTETSLNLSGETYIFVAFAESPFQTANAK